MCQSQKLLQKTVEIFCQSLKFTTDLTMQTNVSFSGRPARHVTTPGLTHCYVLNKLCFSVSDKKEKISYEYSIQFHVWNLSTFM
jgi:hypothetical protein